MDFSSSSDNYNSSDEEEGVTLESINRQRKLTLNITAKYASRWGTVEGFRELVQNWRDGIIRSFRLSEDNFRVVTEDNEDEIVFKVMRNGRHGSKDCLGYIRWACEQGQGMVELTNRQATLQPWNLNMGGGSKASRDDQAGAHGEGLKVALLSMMRDKHNHGVICRSGGFTWTFNFDKEGKLIAFLRRMTPATLDRLAKKTNASGKNTLRPIHAIPNKDVQFLIQGGMSGRNQEGYEVKRVGVSRDEFLTRTKSALFLQEIPRDGIVRTTEGELLLQPSFKGRIYLKGLFLSESKSFKSASVTGKELKYGYNFFSGQTDRERRSMAGGKEECEAIMSIWNEALKSPSDQNNLVPLLHEMLCEDPGNYCADVIYAEEFISSSTTLKLKDYLLSEKFKGLWFYESRELKKDERFMETVSGFGYQPYKLGRTYWKILEEYLRTASEEREDRFKKMETTLLPTTVFAESLSRLVRAGLKGTAQTSGVIVEFVQAGNLSLDIHYDLDTKVFKIHDKWLTLQGAGNEIGLSYSVLPSDLLMRAAQRLLGAAIRQISLEIFRGDDGDRATHRAQAISFCDQRVAEYTYIKRTLKLTITNGDLHNRLTVSWGDYGWVAETCVEIEVHAESTCRHLKQNLISKQRDKSFLSRLDLYGPETKCKSAVLDFGCGSRSFENLTKGEVYFVIFRNTSVPESFIVIAEKPVVAKPVVIKLKKQEKNDTFISAPEMTLSAMAARDWFHATNPKGKKAILGVEKDTAEETTKRKSAIETSESSSKRLRRSGRLNQCSDQTTMSQVMLSDYSLSD